MGASYYQAMKSACLVGLIARSPISDVLWIPAYGYTHPKIDLEDEQAGNRQASCVIALYVFLVFGGCYVNK